jgi:phage shock protein PspC (stress-responsive transcriptional regulator)
MMGLMTPEAILSLTSLALFSLADLRYRVVPGAAVFFLASVIFAAPADPIRVGFVILAVGWGWLRWPSLFIMPALLTPSAWAVVLTGAGVRRKMVGEADLLILGGIACLFDWPATVMALGGIELMRHCQRRPGSVPALPGIFLGLAAYLLICK